MSAACVRAQGLSKHFLVPRRRRTALRALRAAVRGDPLKQEFWVLKDLSFEVFKGDKLAVVGKNGSGKTTLLRILTGIYEPTAGTLLVDGSPSALFNYSVGFMRELSVLDSIFLFGAVCGMSRRFLRDKVEGILGLAELEHLRYAPHMDLSIGQVQRLALSVFFQTPNDFLVFDEVLANVDHGFARHAESFFRSLAASSKTVVMTSHDSAFLQRHCSHAMWLDEGRIRAAGPVQEIVSEYERSFG